MEQTFLQQYDQQPKDCRRTVHHLNTQTLNGVRGRPAVPQAGAEVSHQKAYISLCRCSACTHLPFVISG